MAVELKDLRTKITARTWCFLESESRATGQDIAELVRDILNDWTDIRHKALIEANRLLQDEGEAGTVTGIRGKVGER